MNSTGQYTLILSKGDFYDTVVANVKNLPLQEMFFIDDWYIERLIRNWSHRRLDKEYRRYIFGLLMVPDETIKIDSRLCLWNITREIVDELVSCLAEGFYYDEQVSVIGERLWFEPFDHHEDDKVDPERIIYFLDILDTIYGRVETNGFDTLTWIREIIGEDYLACTML